MFARLLYFMGERRTKAKRQRTVLGVGLAEWSCPVYQGIVHRAGGFLGDQWGLGDLPYFWASDVCSMLVGSVLVLWVGFSRKGSVGGKEGGRREGTRGGAEGGGRET